MAATTVNTAHPVLENFQWQTDYDSVLEHIASTDTIEPDVEWAKLRDIIKYKVHQNIAAFLAEPVPPKKSRSQVTIGTRNGGLQIPPFPPRSPDESPVVYMNAEQAKDLEDFIFTQLDQFEDGPPFTIQRLCELCIRPKEHYAAVGKYLRAVEKTVLVTSPHSAFLPPAGGTPQTAVPSMPVPLLSTAPPTPMFSPITFLHADARRSKSRSPPPSPLLLTSSPEKALGLVDELDDPSPEHLSDHITPLSATTTIPESPGRPFLESLEDRFVKAEEEHPDGGNEKVVLADDANGGKKNNA